MTTATLADEAAFHAAIDAAPDDATLRLVFADWLEERGDPRAEGYRVLATRGLRPRRGVTGHAGYTYGGGESALPAVWFAEYVRVKRAAGAVFTRAPRLAEDAAALAFARLPAARRAELLSPK